MRSLLLASLIALASFGIPIPGGLAHALCATAVVIIKGRVEHPPHSASVRVQLVYSKQKRGGSGEVTVEDGRFTIQIPFLTQSAPPC
jgi:hypothetical protein